MAGFGHESRESAITTFRVSSDLYKGLHVIIQYYEHFCVLTCSVIPFPDYITLLSEIVCIAWKTLCILQAIDL